MRYQIITLEYKSDRMIPISVPLSVGKILRRFAAYDQISGRVVIQSSDYIKQRRFTAAVSAEY